MNKKDHDRLEILSRLNALQAVVNVWGTRDKVPANEVDIVNSYIESIHNTLWR
jgi:hypothetical protein